MANAMMRGLSIGQTAAITVIALLILVASPRCFAIQIPNLSQVLGPQAQSPTSASGDTTIEPSAQVVFDGRPLFFVYGATHLKAQDRADLIAFRLNATLQKLTPADPLPDFTAKPVGEEVVILLAGQPLTTVTQEDSQASGVTAASLSAEWSDQLSRALEQAMRERSPGYMRTALERAGMIVLVAALINILIWILLRRLIDRPGWVTQTFVWLVAAYLITYLFPKTRAIHETLGSGVLRPFSIFIVVSLAAAVLVRLLRVVLLHVFPPIPDHLSAEERTERTRRRRATLGTVSRITGTTIIWTVAAIVALSWMGINISSLLTSAGFLGVIIGLAAQDTMKDLVAGVNILVDDRFGVGDVIQVGTFTGTVEKLNLRVTQLRDLSGRLITFPNRSIESVANFTARWGQVDFQVGVGYDADLRTAMQVMEEAAQSLRNDWPDQIIADPQMLGVESYNDYDITLRMLLRTVPGDQWTVARELRLRVKEAFDKNKITIPSPQQTVVVMGREQGAAGESSANANCET